MLGGEGREGGVGPPQSRGSRAGNQSYLHIRSYLPGALMRAAGIDQGAAPRDSRSQQPGGPFIKPVLPTQGPRGAVLPPPFRPGISDPTAHKNALREESLLYLGTAVGFLGQRESPTWEGSTLAETRGVGVERGQDSAPRRWLPAAHRWDSDHVCKSCLSFSPCKQSLP